MLNQSISRLFLRWVNAKVNDPEAMTLALMVFPPPDMQGLRDSRGRCLYVGRAMRF